jgi:Glycosyl-4,4'-diaponeurosporenoate acyltransferase
MGKAYWIAMLFMAGVLTVCWFDSDVGPGHPINAFLLTGWVFGLTPGVAVPAVRLTMRVLPLDWFRVPEGERVLHSLLGVGTFGWLLERSGWNRRVADPLRGFDVTRATLPALEGTARGGLIAHGVCFAIHALLAAAALVTGYAWGAVWILLPGVVLHLYPVLLQRSIMLRLQPLLADALAGSPRLRPRPSLERTREG